MTNKERLNNNNTRIQECIDKANALPSTKGKPIEINSLDESLLTIDNAGKVYSYDGKLYRIEQDRVITSLDGSTFKFDKQLIGSKEYGFYMTYVKGSINNRSIYSIRFTVDDTSISLSIDDENDVYYGYGWYKDYEEDSGWYLQHPNGNSVRCEPPTIDNFSFDQEGFTGNEDSILQFIVKNAEYIENATYSDCYVFKEISSKKGTLHIHKNQKVDVEDYETVEVDVTYMDGKPINLNNINTWDITSIETYENIHKIYSLNGENYIVLLQIKDMDNFPFPVIVPSGWEDWEMFGEVAFGTIAPRDNDDFPSPPFYPGDWYDGVIYKDNVLHIVYDNGFRTDVEFGEEFKFYLSYFHDRTSSINLSKLLDFFIKHGAITLEDVSVKAKKINIQPSGEFEINFNGKFSISSYESVNVKVYEPTEMVPSAMDRELKNLPIGAVVKCVIHNSSTNDSYEENTLYIVVEDNGVKSYKKLNKEKTLSLKGATLVFNPKFSFNLEPMPFELDVSGSAKLIMPFSATAQNNFNMTSYYNSINRIATNNVPTPPSTTLDNRIAFVCDYSNEFYFSAFFGWANVVFVNIWENGEFVLSYSSVDTPLIISDFDFPDLNENQEFINWILKKNIQLLLPRNNE